MDTHILVIDDMAAIRSVIEKVLNRAGFSNVTQAEDGSIGWEIIQNNIGKESEVGLIICDWNMPNVTGIELLQMVRSSTDLKDLPFLMVTTEGAKSNVLEALSAGVSNYVIKPVNPDSLMQKVYKVLNLS